MIVGAAGELALPKWRMPDPVIILPPAASVVTYNYEVGVYDVGFALAPVKAEGGVILYDQFRKVLAPGLLKVWQDHYNDPEFEDLFK